MPRRDSLDLLAYVLTIGLCVVWGFNQILAKTVNAGISPVMQAGLRSVGAVVLVWAWSSLRGVKLFERDGSLIPGIAAGLMFAGQFALMYLGLQHTAASRATIFLYSSPFIVALGVNFFVPGERLRWVQVLGLIGAFSGIGVAFSSGLGLPTGHQLLGDGLEFVAAILWGATTVLVKASRLSAISANKTLFYQLGVSALVLPPISWLMGEPGVFALTPVIVGAFAIQTVLVATVTYLTWFWLIATYPAGQLSFFTFLTPLFGVAAGWLVLSEPISWDMLIGLALVVAGLCLVNRRSSPVTTPLVHRLEQAHLH